MRLPGSSGEVSWVGQLKWVGEVNRKNLRYAPLTSLPGV